MAMTGLIIKLNHAARCVSDEHPHLVTDFKGGCSGNQQPRFKENLEQKIEQLKRELPITTSTEGLPQPATKDSPADSHTGACRAFQISRREKW
jgi:hypothetical protein